MLNGGPHDVTVNTRAHHLVTYKNT